ncbi:beta-carotene isomerase D27, chloroplastic-like [Papaver somniferum]|uniref:beta-carotene isomerase D27, chloroplastic-like n=1 Tax=Papaver somniferum TaxID=3469 RepID=UPI000E6F6B0A|nr:beta-carotene isomerase D27, chloroplastic-like [Papaver somniferum]
MLSSQPHRGCSLVSSNVRVATKFTHNSKCYSPRSAIVRAVLTTKPTATTSTTNVIDHAIPTPIVYKDNWFDRLAIKHISQSIQAITEIKNDKSGYESFVEASAAVIQISKDTKMQQELVIQTLNKAFPKRILSLV